MAEAHAFGLVGVVVVVPATLVMMLTIRAHAARHLRLPSRVDRRGWERIEGG